MCQKGDILWKIVFIQNVSLVMLYNFCHDKHCLKIKLKCVKLKITEKCKLTAINYIGGHGHSGGYDQLLFGRLRYLAADIMGRITDYARLVLKDQQNRNRSIEHRFN